MENECRAGKEKESGRGRDNSRNGAEIRIDRKGWTEEIRDETEMVGELEEKENCTEMHGRGNKKMKGINSEDTRRLHMKGFTKCYHKLP